MRKRIIPSIIAKNQRELDELLKKFRSCAKLVQLDVMDGKFVQNKSLWFDMKLDKKLKYEVHLMVKNPEIWVEKYGKQVDVIIFHIETVKDPTKVIEMIRKKGKKVGVAVNPETPVKRLVGVIDYVDQVTVMTVVPGKYGSKFLPKTLEKVKFLRRVSSKIDIEVDGGISDKTIMQAKKAGANKYISGSYLLGQKSVKEGLQKLRKKIK